MKIDFIGTGTLGSLKRGNSSILINETILMDIGSGVFTQLKYLEKDIFKIKYIIITHYHADHFLDMAHFLLYRYIRKEQEKVYIIGPQGIREKIVELMYFTHGDNEPNKYDYIEEKYNIEFIELENNSYESDSFKIDSYSLKHDTCTPCSGYILYMNGLKIAYTGDTTECENLEKMIIESSIIFIDTTQKETTKSHIGLSKILEYASLYKEKKFYLIHRSDLMEVEEQENVFVPTDGDIVNL